ncbi:signal peptidase I [Sphingomonas jaspsi]|uniref:signal peptidase I n=1 Tax=Sphingomonas jaspsi TaxID=392409 RepID=UPI0004AEEAED|nr:signal peptidase I [Sphingomonas jaspsi]
MSDPVEPVASETAAPQAATPAETPKETKGQMIWREAKGMFWVLVAVLLFHSFIAKPFYIPSESMMPRLLTGDRLVVTKYPYGWSYVSPTIPNPAAIVRSLILRQGPEPWGITLPFMKGRVLGKLPERGDIVVVTPPGKNEDYIKRVIGLPGDTIELRNGRLFINGQAVKAEVRPPLDIPVDANAPCGENDFWNRREETAAGTVCRLPIVRETLPNGVTYDTIDDGNSEGDTFGPIKVPADHLFLMGDNRDHSADSRYELSQQGLGGPVPFENIGGRAEFITFSLDGSGIFGFRSGRSGDSLRGQKE